VGLALYYGIGSRNEERGRSGFAHLFEHMMFQGSANVGKAEHFRHISAWGGQANGTTSRERTNYFEALPSNQLGLGLWLEADRMRSLAVTPENFENQRQTVMEERRQRIDDSPYGEAMVRLGEISYRNWAYGHPVIGSWEDLKNAQFDEVVDFHQTWYRPDNAVLAIAGDVDVEQAMAWINEFYGDIPAGPPRAAPNLTQELRTAAVHEQVADPIAQLPAVFINHQAPPFNHENFPVYEVIEAILFRGQSSRVFRRLVLEEATAVQISGGYEAHNGPSLFGMFGVAGAGAHDDLGKIVAGYKEELDRMANALVSKRELETAIHQIQANWVFRQEGVLNRALALGSAELFHADPLWDKKLLDRVALVTAEDVQKVVQTAFPQHGEVILEVHPR